LLRDENGKSKGVAYISFSSESEAEKGLELNGTKLDNRIIIVAIADPNKRKEKNKKMY
jgi:RNA recognition motif-containing protein